MALETPKVYRPRQPEGTELYQLIRENFDHFEDTFYENYFESYGPLTDRAKLTFEKFLKCGRLDYGFARVRCPECANEFLVAFSCQMRGICSSCHQKRAEVLSSYLEDEVIEAVSHRQFVYVIPRKFRHLFLQNKFLLNFFLRAAVDATQEFFRWGVAKDEVSAGIVAVPQMFGDRLNPHPHVHALVTEGAFDKSGKFFRLRIEPQLEIDTLTRLFTEKLLSYLVSTNCLSAEFREEILAWEYSGFSVDASVRVEKGDRAKMRRLIRYMARPPISQERLKYDPKTGEAHVYSTKKWMGQRKWVETSSTKRSNATIGAFDIPARNRLND